MQRLVEFGTNLVAALAALHADDLTLDNRWECARREKENGAQQGAPSRRYKKESAKKRQRCAPFGVFMRKGTGKCY